jgi:hypothetical protein
LLIFYINTLPCGSQSKAVNRSAAFMKDLPFAGVALLVDRVVLRHAMDPMASSHRWTARAVELE